MFIPLLDCAFPNSKFSISETMRCCKSSPVRKNMDLKSFLIARKNLANASAKPEKRILKQHCFRNLFSPTPAQRINLLLSPAPKRLRAICLIRYLFYPVSLGFCFLLLSQGSVSLFFGNKNYCVLSKTLTSHC